MAKPSAAFTVDQMYTALDTSDGFFYLAARALNCSAKTVERYVYKHQRLRDLVKQHRGQRIDVVEGVLWNKAKNGEPWAVCFFLKTQAKDRGYTERQEVTGEDGTPLRFVVEVPPRSETTEEWLQQYKQSITSAGGHDGHPNEGCKHNRP